MVSPGKQHCVSCIGTLSFPIVLHCRHMGQTGGSQRRLMPPVSGTLQYGGPF